MKNYFKHILATIFLLLIVQHSAFAGREDRTSSIHTPQGGSAVEIGTSTAIDSVELEQHSIYQMDYNVMNRISFGVDMQYFEFVSDKQIVEVSIDVKQFDKNNMALPDLNFKLNIAYHHHDTLNSIILDDI